MVGDAVAAGGGAGLVDGDAVVAGLVVDGFERASPSSQPAAISSGVRRAGGPAPSDDMSNSTWSAKHRFTAPQSRWSVATKSSVMTSMISCWAARVSAGSAFAVQGYPPPGRLALVIGLGGLLADGDG